MMQPDSSLPPPTASAADDDHPGEDGYSSQPIGPATPLPTLDPVRRDDTRIRRKADEFDYGDSSRVLLIHTGGTIGMKRGPKGFVPFSGYFPQVLRGISTFHELGWPLYTMPPSWVGKRVRYDILEFDPLLDSSNMGIEDWARIATTIGDHYEEYDGFVVTHGTDTMAFTASALSFMLENLGKPVVLTGSQIPISQLRSDAADNLLGAMVVAGHFLIPEVGLYFHQRLMRGNRVRKVDASALNAFESGNLDPLVKVGIDIDVDWQRILQPTGRPLKVHTAMDPNVTTVRVFPGMSAEAIRNLLRPPIRACVLETYGAGNAPDRRQDFLDALREANDSGVVLVAVTQCARGRVSTSYAAGQALADAGVISGSDLTPEAALAKLSYLLAKPEYDTADVKRLMQKDLRGELTARSRETRFSFTESAFMQAVADALNTHGNLPYGSELAKIEGALYPVLLCSAGASGDVKQLRQLVGQGADPNIGDYDARTALHLAAAEGQLEAVRYLLDAGANPVCRDRWNQTPAADAEARGHHDVVALLRERSPQS